MLDRLVTLAVSPLGTTLLLLLLAMAVRGRLRMLLMVFAFGWLWIWATPLASDALRATLEDRAGPREVQQIGRADAIVVLGGSMAAAKPPRRPYPDLNAASDRVWHAARLYHAGKAPRILLSGGAWRSEDAPEAPAMRDFLVELRVPAAAVLLESRSRDTQANAAQSRDLLAARGVQRVILVTSALHMQRARRNFEKAGVAVIPAPTDFEVVDEPFELLRVLPNTSALDGSARAFKVWVGFVAVIGR